LNQIATTSVQATINLKELRKIEIPFPEKKERETIASILSALDDKIDLNLQMNKTLEEMALALYKHWFVDFGPFQNGEFVESELGMIPKGWEVKPIGQLVKILGGFAFKSKDFIDEGEPVVKIKNISGNVVSIDGSVCIPESVAQRTNNKFIIPAGSFLVAMTGAEVGKVGVVPDYGKRLWLNQRVGMVTQPEFQYAEILVGNFLQGTECYEIIQNLAYGSAQPNISTTGLESIFLSVPQDISIMREVLQQIGSWHNMKINNYNEIQTLTTLRDTLLPKLISGEVRVKKIEQTIAQVL
jgi:type I restriction enzyme S subunit